MYQAITRLAEGRIISSWRAVTSAGQRVELRVEPSFVVEHAGACLVEVDPECSSSRQEGGSSQF
jgi:hypothetical protein